LKPGESDIPNWRVWYSKITKAPQTKSHRWCGAVSINKCSRQFNTHCAFSATF
jgi:hypothetical protein